jgi:hypothetical protein
MLFVVCLHWFFGSDVRVLLTLCSKGCRRAVGDNVFHVSMSMGSLFLVHCLERMRGNIRVTVPRCSQTRRNMFYTVQHTRRVLADTMLIMHDHPPTCMMKHALPCPTPRETSTQPADQSSSPQENVRKSRQNQADTDSGRAFVGDIAVLERALLVSVSCCSRLLGGWL